MKSSCITYPKSEPLLVIRRSQVDICKGNFLAASLLSYFVYWHEWKMREQERQRGKPVLFEHQGEQIDAILLQHHTRAELMEQMMGLVGSVNTLDKAINHLVKLGFISKHKNPKKGFGFDKTVHYLVHISTIQDAINSQAIENPTKVKNDLREIKNDLREIKNDRAIPKITTEITTEKKELDLKHLSSKGTLDVCGPETDDSLSSQPKGPELDSGITALFEAIPATPQPPATTTPPDVEAVFNHWRQRMGKPRAKMLDSRIKLISKAFNMGYSANDLCEAIDGCARSPHHMGDNRHGTRYDSLELILKDGGKIESFIAMNTPIKQFAGRRPGISERDAEREAIADLLRC